VSRSCTYPVLHYRLSGSALGKINLSTKEISILAGEITRNVDGAGNEARFNIYLLDARFDDPGAL